MERTDCEEEEDDDDDGEEEDKEDEEEEEEGEDGGGVSKHDGELPTASMSREAACAQFFAATTERDELFPGSTRKRPLATRRPCKTLQLVLNSNFQRHLLLSFSFVFFFMSMTLVLRRLRFFFFFSPLYILLRSSNRRYL